MSSFLEPDRQIADCESPHSPRRSLKRVDGKLPRLFRTRTPYLLQEHWQLGLKKRQQLIFELRISEGVTAKVGEIEDERIGLLISRGSEHEEAGLLWKDAIAGRRLH
jgi:hypothetical protein